MDEQMKNNFEGEEVNFKRLIDAALRKAWMIVLTSLVGALAMMLITFFFITPQYKSSAMFYVNNNAISVGSSLRVDSGDISASKSLVNTYIVILNTRETLLDVIDYADINRTYGELKDMIHAESVDETEVFRVVVTSEDPQEAEKIADAIAYILPTRISNIVEGTSAKIVDSAVVPSSPSSPSYTVNTLMGFLIGFVLSAGLIILQELFNVTVRTEEDVTQVCRHPILASVPDMAAPSKGTYYGYGKHKGTKKPGAYAAGKQASNQRVLIGSGISFAASEAYKLLRTKLQFSFADDNDCRIIGLSSALSGEGKSLTAINLAHTLSQLDKKVILIDCDMRRPTTAEKLGLPSKPGLSNFLTGQSNTEGLIQHCDIKNEENAFHVITAGEIPPNPIELLSSKRMAAVLKGLRKAYDYIILDLPPVSEVSDALAVAKETDGILLVVRQNYCDRIALNDAIHQFDFVNSKILGVVLNCASEYGGKYEKGYYRRYYRAYHKYRAKQYERQSHSDTAQK